MLIGGKEGNVYTRIAEMDTFGAVCDDTWNLISVNFYFILLEVCLFSYPISAFSFHIVLHFLKRSSGFGKKM